MKDFSLNGNGNLSVINSLDNGFAQYSPVDNFPLPQVVGGGGGGDVLNPEPIAYAPLPFELGNGNNGDENFVNEPTFNNYNPTVTGFVAGGNAPQLPTIGTSQQIAEYVANAALVANAANAASTAIVSSIPAAPAPTQSNIASNEIPTIKSFERTKKMVKWGLIIMVVVVVGAIGYSLIKRK